MYILGTDYDGTLSYHGVSQRNRDAIDRFRAAGNLFGVVTGRDYAFYHVMRRENLPLDFILCMNGGMLVATDGDRSGQMLLHRTQSNRGEIRWVIEHVGQVYGQEVGVVLGTERTTFHALFPDGSDKYAPLSRADELPSFTQMNTWFKDEEDARRATAEINERWPESLGALQNGVCVDIPPHGVDKGAGIASLADLMGVPYSNCYCAGDNLNDIQMIRRFHGCAVENAVPAVKEAAEGVYPDVAAMIDRILAL